MHGVGPPLVTPFTETGDIDYDALRALVEWVETRGVDFIVPCGSNSEAELMTATERARVIETVVETASVPVLAGTGHPGRKETLEATAGAGDAGADAALVITPFYYEHDQETLATYYRDVADSANIPVYLYSVPSYTGVQLEPETVETLATHPNIAGMKDSAGDLGAFIRTKRRTVDAEFDLFVGSGSLLAQACSAGASGGVLALANLCPERVAEIYDADPERARELNEELVEINTAITATYGVPGLKWAMKQRGAPAGYPRSPHSEPTAEERAHLESLLSEL
jgi:4-hydroxy-tetrahydrodipicolinate synthase